MAWQFKKANFDYLLIFAEYSIILSCSYLLKISTMDLLTIQTPLWKFGIWDKFGKYIIDSITKSEQEKNCFHVNAHINDYTVDTVWIIYSHEAVIEYNMVKNA